jgi:hypothetical protein
MVRLVRLGQVAKMDGDSMTRLEVVTCSEGSSDNFPIDKGNSFISRSDSFSTCRVESSRNQTGRSRFEQR